MDSEKNKKQPKIDDATMVYLIELALKRLKQLEGK